MTVFQNILLNLTVFHTGWFILNNLHEMEKDIRRISKNVDKYIDDLYNN